jgi:hypothetical protein
LAFAGLVFLVKRNVSKFISFYVLRKDYQRMRIIEKEESPNIPAVEFLPNPDELIDDPKLHHKSSIGEDGVPNVPPATPQAPYVAPISVNRSMTREEIS